MPREFPRSRRLSEQLKRELGELVRRELNDPRLRLVTLTEVEVARDLGHARVYFSMLGDASDKAVAEVTSTLQGAAGHLRHRLGRMLRLRTIPQLAFEWDSSIERGARLTALIDSVNASPAPGEDT